WEAVARDVGVVGDHAYAPGPQKICNPAADAAQPDQSYGDARVAILAGAQVRALEILSPPAALLYELVTLPDLLQKSQDHPDRPFRHAAPVRFCRAVRHQDPEIGGGIHVDVVDTDRVFRDDTQ